MGERLTQRAVNHFLLILGSRLDYISQLPSQLCGYSHVTGFGPVECG